MIYITSQIVLDFPTISSKEKIERKARRDRYRTKKGKEIVWELKEKKERKGNLTD